jgi:hypothetical protein
MTAARRHGVLAATDVTGMRKVEDEELAAESLSRWSSGELRRPSCTSDTDADRLSLSWNAGVLLHGIGREPSEQLIADRNIGC